MSHHHEPHIEVTHTWRVIQPGATPEELKDLEAHMKAYWPTAALLITIAGNTDHKGLCEAKGKPHKAFSIAEEMPPSFVHHP
jgi:hypothetical protein